MGNENVVTGVDKHGFPHTLPNGMYMNRMTWNGLCYFGFSRAVHPCLSQRSVGVPFLPQGS
jgi:hypothetical protein